MLVNFIVNYTLFADSQYPNMVSNNIHLFVAITIVTFSAFGWSNSLLEINSENAVTAFLKPRSYKHILCICYLQV